MVREGFGWRLWWPHLSGGIFRTVCRASFAGVLRVRGWRGGGYLFFGLTCFHPAEEPGEAVATVEEIGLVGTSEVGVEVGDAGMVGAFEVKGHGGAGEFADELVEQEVIGFGCAAGGESSGMDQIKAMSVAEEDGGAQGLPLFVEYRSY